MHRTEPRGKTGARWLMVVLVVAAAFGLGWLGAKVQDVSRLDPRQVIANRWVGDLGLLVGNVNTRRPIDADETQSLIRWGLNIDSATLAQLYDSMSPDQKRQVAFYIPKARAVIAQEPKGARHREDGWMLAFVDCVQQVQSRGGSVGKCFEDRKADSGKVASE